MASDFSGIVRAMNESAVPKGVKKCTVAFLAAALAVALAISLPGAVATASAAKMVARNGRIYACYRLGGGRAKGSVRLVPRRMHCRRGERKLSWSVRGPRGPAGQSGSAGAAGGAALEARLSSLESRLTELGNRVGALEGVLEGIANAQLREAIAAVADVKALCTQMTTVTDRVDALGGAFEGLGLGGVIPAGLELLAPALPAALPSFACP